MTRVILVALFMVMAVSASAQECEIAAYGNRAGTWRIVDPVEGHSFSVFVVIRAEATVAAAAYSIEFPGLNRTLFQLSRFTGPSGSGLHIDEPTGTSSALGECVVGFGGNPIVVDEYVFVSIPGFVGGPVSISPNESQSPYNPRFVTCNDVILDCEAGPDMYFGIVIPTDAKSFGAVKSLYHQD